MTEYMQPLPFASVTLTLSSRLPERLQTPRIGIVCGSGLGGLVGNLRDVVQVPYEELEGFSKSTVPGHRGVLAFGMMGRDVPVVAMLGRLHPYEGHKLSAVAYPIRVMADLGVKDIIITNASGSLNPAIPVGTIVVIRDHLALPNLTGLNPLFGPLTSPTHARFLPLSDAYSPALRRLAFLAAHHLSLHEDALMEGTYAWVSGPTYETAAEGRFLRHAGADVVGMSTVPEVVAARDEGMRVLVLSLVTNAVVIPEKERSIKAEVEAELAGRKLELPPPIVVSHEEVLKIAKEKSDVMRRLVEAIVDLVP